MNVSLIFNVPCLLSWIWLIGLCDLCNVVHILCCFLNVLSFQHKFTIVGCDCLQFIVQKILLYFHISPRTSQKCQLEIEKWKLLSIVLKVYFYFKNNWFLSYLLVQHLHFLEQRRQYCLWFFLLHRKLLRYIIKEYTYKSYIL